MNATKAEVHTSRFALRKTIIEIINAKLQQADHQLKKFFLSQKLYNQNPTRHQISKNHWSNDQNKVFDFIESSSDYTTKLLHLRANLTEYNSELVLHLLTTNQVKELPLKQLKNIIK